MRINLIDLFVLLLFLLVVYGGSRIGRLIGTHFAPEHTTILSVIGALAIPAVLVGIGLLDSVLSDRYPPYCSCGASIKVGFRHSKDDRWLLVDQCLCGRKYVMKGDRKWYEVMPDNSARLLLVRGFLYKWKRATEKQVARKAIQPPS